MPRNSPARLSVPDRQEAVLAALHEYPLYLIISDNHVMYPGFVPLAEKAVRGGVRIIQLRLKHLPFPEFHVIATEIRRITAKAQCLLIVNDSLDYAIEFGADGVHLGQEDMPVAQARALAPDLIIGASARTCQKAWKAEVEGADYIGCGSVFPSLFKTTAPVIGLKQLAAVNRYVSIPVVGIGGIDVENCKSVLDTDVAGFCTISAFQTSEVGYALRRFREAIFPPKEEV